MGVCVCGRVCVLACVGECAWACVGVCLGEIGLTAFFTRIERVDFPLVGPRLESFSTVACMLSTLLLMFFSRLLFQNKNNSSHFRSSVHKLSL